MSTGTKHYSILLQFETASDYSNLLLVLLLNFHYFEKLRYFCFSYTDITFYFSFPSLSLCNIYITTETFQKLILHLRQYCTLLNYKILSPFTNDNKSTWLCTTVNSKKSPSPTSMFGLHQYWL